MILKFKNNKNGMTLIEILVSISILSLVIFGIISLFPKIYFSSIETNIKKNLYFEKNNIIYSIKKIIDESNDSIGIYSYGSFYEEDNILKNKIEKQLILDIKDILEKDYGVKYNNISKTYSGIINNYDVNNYGNLLKFNDLYDREKDILIGNNFCKNDDLINCIIPNSNIEINNKFDILIVKKKMSIIILFVNNGKLIYDERKIDLGDNNNILDINISLDKRIISNSYINEFKMLSNLRKGLFEDFSGNNNFLLNIKMKNCYLEYNGDNINYDKFICF